MSRVRCIVCSLILLLVNPALATFQPEGVPFESPVTVAPGFSASVLFSNLTTPRGITIDSAFNILVVERGFGVTAFAPAANKTGWERTVVIQNPNFTQGIQVSGSALYVSTAGQVLLYSYDSSTKSVADDSVAVVNGLPPDGDLTTHTLQLEFTPTGENILIASGPFSNIDPTARNASSGRSQIRRLPIQSPPPLEPPTFLSGELIAFGIRNPAGFAFSPVAPASTLIVVENGASIDNVTGLTAKFVNDNPADEINSVDLHFGLGESYGFPDCTTIWNPKADPVGVPKYVNFNRGEQFSLQLEPQRNDSWCQKEINNRSPVLSFQAHSVPLDIKFYTPQPSSHSSAFPKSYYNDAFVSFHGSFDRTPPTGYGVVHVPFTGSRPTSQNYTFLVVAANITSCPGTCIRPVGLVFGPDGRLYVTSDNSGELFVIEKS